MADNSDRIHGDVGSSSATNEVDEVKKDLEGWREVLLPLSKVAIWEKTYYPAIIFGITTLIFALIWYFEPSVLTTISLIGLIIGIIDFVVPIVGPSLCASGSWTVTEEREFEGICTKVVNARNHVLSLRSSMAELKVEKPKVYFILVMGVLVAFAWIGSLFNNLFLTYFFVNILLAVPGLRRYGIIQKYLRAPWVFIKRLINGKNKQKTN